MTDTAAPVTDPKPAEVQIPRISTALLIIGVSGAGKTSLLETYARYLWETYKKVLFLYSWDGGAIPTSVQKAMRQGIIRFWRVRTRSATGLGIETLYKATKGYVPRHINVETGETAPAVELIPPVQSKYTCSCPQGHQLAVVSYVALIQATYCTPCGKLIDRNQIRIVEESHRTKGLELIGGVAFDGLTSMTNVVMEHMDHARGAGDIGGEKAAFGGNVVSGDIKLGGNNRADVGFGQSRAQQFVNNSLSIPYLVEGPVFTALTAEASEEGLAIVGAKLPGRAATDEASSWFGNVLEAGTIKNEAGKDCRALYIRPFIDKQGRKHLLKTSGSPGVIPDILQDPAEDEKKYFVGFNLGLYYRLLDQDLKNALGSEPMLVDGLADYGEAPSTGPAPAAPVPGPTATTGAAASTSPTPSVSPAALGAPPAATKRARSAPSAVAPPAPAVAAAAPAVDSPVSTTTAGAPPPPPGARPPQRAPGT